MNTIDLVREFHEAFGVETPDFPSTELCNLRVSLIDEESGELNRALKIMALKKLGTGVVDKALVLDALCDLQYVLDGAFLVFGLDDVKDAAMKEVHRSNMSKLGEDGKPLYRADGKVLKGPNYQPPNLKDLVNNA
jgi:predicted HAD superfamily Cof-like phosphohydrolase